MKTIDLDARQWRTPDDFYESLLSSLGAPEWHGRNLDALWDSITSGNINSISPPFAVRVQNVPEGDLRLLLSRVEKLFLEARTEGIDVRFILRQVSR